MLERNCSCKVRRRAATLLGDVRRSHSCEAHLIECLQAMDGERAALRAGSAHNDRSTIALMDSDAGSKHEHPMLRNIRESILCLVRYGAPPSCRRCQGNNFTREANKAGRRGRVHHGLSRSPCSGLPTLQRCPGRQGSYSTAVYLNTKRHNGIEIRQSS